MDCSRCLAGWPVILLLWPGVYTSEEFPEYNDTWAILDFVYVHRKIVKRFELSLNHLLIVEEAFIWVKVARPPSKLM